MPARSRARSNQHGYILLTLMLVVALMAIFATAAAPSIAFRIKRDREEEMIHRGVQYARAIRRFVKKTGGYPVRLEQLENTNNIRFLRKRYKDPITGKDFKILHQQDVKISFGPGINGANPVGGNPAPGAAAAGATATSGTTGGANAVAGTGSQGQDSNQPDSSTQLQSINSQGATDTSDKLSATVFGGGPIYGVVSASKDQSIREFNKKDHYNQWQFIYDPNTDRGGLLSTPNQPPLLGAFQAPSQGATGTANTTGAGFGSANGTVGMPGQTPQTNPPPQPQPPPEQQ